MQSELAFPWFTGNSNSQDTGENVVIAIISSNATASDHVQSQPASPVPMGNVSSAAALVGQTFGANYPCMPPAWLDKFTTASRRLQALPRGWDGAGSVPPSKTALFKAERITRDALADQPNASAPYLVPAGDGSVQVEWHGTNAEVELTVDPSGHLSFWSRDHLTGRVHEGEDDRARNLFFNWAPWASSTHRNAFAEIDPAAQSPHSAGLAFHTDSSIA